MFVSFQEVFNPTPEQKKKKTEQINRCIRANVEKLGEDCTNCKYQKYVRQSPYYDYTTCKFDESVELPGGLDYRYRCDRYEFMGYLEVEDEGV